MKRIKYITIITIALIASATSCREDPKKPPIPDPPVITIINPESLEVINLQDVLPYIQGSVTTDCELTNVSIFVTRGAMRQRIAEHTTFENSKEFAINFRPEYTLDMTGIRVQATDAHNQTTTLDFAFQVISESTAPIITITNPEGMVVNLQSQAHPYIQGSVISANDLTKITISVAKGETIQKIQEITTFEDPRNFAINFLLEYTLDMTGIRIEATDARDQISTLDFAFGVVDVGLAINFTTPEGLIVDFNTVNFENLPRIQGAVTAGAELTNVRIFTVTTTNVRQLIEEHTTFAIPQEFQINVQPDYRPNMNRLRVIATNSAGETDSSDFAFQVTDFTMPTELTPATGDRLAFPTAEGAGRYTVGGRGGNVLVVTNLNDSGPGSFRWAVTQPGARTVIFDVSGTITLNSRLTVNQGNLTIAGQTAPGDGITIRNHEFVIAADNVIIRFMRFRLGDRDLSISCLRSIGRRDIIIDHVSSSWSGDKLAALYNIHNFTMQWSILSEPILEGANGRSFTSLLGGKPGTFHHNLIAHSRSRNPRLSGVRLQNWSLWGGVNGEFLEVSNNVIYNWGNSENMHGGEEGHYNIRNNFFKPGPATPTGVQRDRFVVAYAAVDNNNGSPNFFLDYGRFYMSGNVMEGNTTITNDNWAGGITGGMTLRLPTGGTSNRRHIDSVRVTTPFVTNPTIATSTTMAINLRTAEEAYELVLERAGASLRRDAVDIRVINETRTGTSTFGNNGLITSQNQVGGWPVLNSLPPDPRHLRGTANDDGIPDWFKIKHRLPLGQNMANRYSLSPYYTNLEMYLNSLVEHIHNP